MIRLAMVLLMAAIAAGCTTDTPRRNMTEGTGDPYFDCRNGQYARTHIPLCSGILR